MYISCRNRRALKNEHPLSLSFFLVLSALHHRAPGAVVLLAKVCGPMESSYRMIKKEASCGKKNSSSGHVNANLIQRMKKRRVSGRHAKDGNVITGTTRRWKLEHVLSNVKTLQRREAPTHTTLQVSCASISFRLRRACTIHPSTAS
jgi:hypothetical protein